MARLPMIDPKTATGKAKELLDAVQAKLKITPNMTKVMANSPAVLQAYLGFSGALAEGTLDVKLREQIALAVGQSNQCQYCVSAHTAIGKMVGLPQSELVASRSGHSTSPKSEAALSFSKKVIADGGKASAAEVAALRTAGFSDAEIAEIVAHIALNVFTNYFNNITEVDVDFPKVDLLQVA